MITFLTGLAAFTGAATGTTVAEVVGAIGAKVVTLAIVKAVIDEKKEKKK